MLEITKSYPLLSQKPKYQYFQPRKSLCQQSQWMGDSVSSVGAMQQFWIWPLSLTLKSDRKTQRREHPVS